MGANVYPVNAVTGAPSYTGRMLRQTAVGPFVAMGTTARPLGAKSGIRPGTPSSIVSVVSGTWTVHPFAGVIDGESLAIAGPYTYAFDSDQTGSLGAAGSAARVDRLDVQVSDPAEGDGTSVPAITIIRTQGAATGGATPAAPARSHKLCLINVPVSGSPTVSWAPDWMGDPSEWTFNTLAERDAYTTLITSANVPVQQVATVIADVTTANNGEYLWTGSAWKLISIPGRDTSTFGRVAFTPTITNFTKGSTVYNGWYEVHNGFLTGFLQMTLGAGWFISGGAPYFAPPVPMAFPTDGGDVGSGNYHRVGTGDFKGELRSDPSGNIKLGVPGGSGAYWSALTATTPAGWQNGDIFTLNFGFPV